MSISLVEVCARLGRRTRAGDFSSLNFTEQADMLAAINAALQRTFNVLPIYFKEKTVGVLLPAPLAIASIDVVQYSKDITGYAFTSEQIGQTVQLGSDPQWNQIVAPQSLLNPYMGISANVTGTIYGNATYSTETPFDHIIGNPQFADQTLAGLFPINMAVQNGGQNMDWIYQQNIGRPTAWWTQVMGGSQGQSPLMVMRFAPAPDTAYAIKVRIGVWPHRLLINDYNSNTALVVPEQFIEPAFIKMCMQEFSSSPACNADPETKKQMIIDGKEGELYLKNQVQVIGVPMNRQGTPRGY